MEFYDYLLRLSSATRTSVDWDTITYINWDELPKKYKSRKNFKRWKDSDYVQIAFKSFVDGNINRFLSSSQLINPNLLAYFIDNDGCKIVEEEGIYYLVDKDSSDSAKLNQIRINKQSIFSYEFFTEIKNYCTKMKQKGKQIYINNLLGENGNLKVKLKNVENNNKRVYNYFIIKLTDDIPIGFGLEFLEQNENIEDQSLELIKEEDAFRTSAYPNLKHTAYVWEELWKKDEGYRFYYISELDKMFSMYY